MRIFILEDDGTRMQLFREALFDKGHVIIHRGTAPNAIRAFGDQARYDLMLLDHDLAQEHYTDLQKEWENTGLSFVKYLDGKPPVCPVIVHSWNPDGARKMEEILLKNGWDVKRQPFGLTLLNHLRELT